MNKKTKENLRKYGVIVLALLLTVFIYYRGYLKEASLIKDVLNAESALSLTKEDLGKAQSEVVRWKDKYGKEHLRSEKLVVDKAIIEAVSVEQARLLKIKPKQIEGSTIVTTETIFKEKFDTLYQDNYIYIEKTKDSLSLALNDTLIFTEYWKRTWFLGRKRHFVDLQNKNPYIKLTGLKTIEAKGKSPTIIIGPSLSYNILTNRPVVGFSLLYYPLTLKL